MAGNVGGATTSDATAVTAVSANIETTRTGEANLAHKNQEASEQTITLKTFGPIYQRQVRSWIEKPRKKRGDGKRSGRKAGESCRRTR